MPPRTDQPWPLSVHRAFVVQLHTDANVEEGCVIGRVEHVVSGQIATFQSVDALANEASEADTEGHRGLAMASNQESWETTEERLV